MPSKQEKFADFETFKNCFTLFYENLAQGFDLKGKWRSEYFKNDHPIILELGCGKGEYTIGLAKSNTGKNYIGVDIKGNRIWTGASQALAEKMDNVGFLRTRIDFIDYCFTENEVDEIWITFPDPQPQESREKKRLTYPGFLNKYKTFLKPGGFVNLKTDNDGLYAFTVETVKELGLTCHKKTEQLYKSEFADSVLSIKTHYERIYLKHDKNINYIQFSL